VPPVIWRASLLRIIGSDGTPIREIMQRHATSVVGWETDGRIRCDGTTRR
jgi:hypothetical protein